MVNLFITKDKKMKVYFLKTDIHQYVIFPTPEDESLYFVLDIDSDEELSQKTPVLHKGKLVLVDKQPSPAHEWDGKAWVISPAKQTALLSEQRDNLIDQIDNHAATIYSTWTRFESEYRERQTAAETFKSANYEGECSRYITDFAKRAGLNNKAATDLILVQAAGLEKLQIELANQRMRKYELKASNLTLEQMQSIYDDIIKQMDALMEAYNNG